MSKITGLVKGRGKSVRLYIDGRFAFNLETEVVLKEGLNIGRELSDSQIEGLKEANRFQKCLGAALHFLSYRPRSEHEVRQRLILRGFNENDIEQSLCNLKRQGLIDDNSFARFWKDNRQSFNIRGRSLIETELRQKGVSVEIIQQELSEIDDSDCAYRAALKHVRNLNLTDYPDFCRRLGGYLRRRGFGYEVIKTTTIRLWNEKEGGEIADSPSGTQLKSERY